MPCHPTRRASAACFAFLAIISLHSIAAGADSPPSTLVFTASEVPGLASGVPLPSDGKYTIFAWTPSAQAWSVKLDGSQIKLTPNTVKGDQMPSWQAIGTVERTSGKKITLAIVAPEKPKPTEKEKEKDAAKAKTPAKAAAKEEAPKPLPVPVLLAFSTDAKADLNGLVDVIRARVDTIEPIADPRRLTVRTRNEGANFQPPLTKQEWLDRAAHVREQMWISLGLWPAFPKTDMHPRVFGKIERDGYTIEKVVLETLPGFTLSGNLYRPTGKSGKLPLVLCPHGHWTDGRVNPSVQARCVWWAKQLGCVVFMYDMVGYNDSKEFGHAFLNDRLKRWGLSLFTLQTWNSIRALDWATTLPDVDPARVGCTGESGGGTQTFVLTALDQRIKVSAPVVMVSHKMQGGCLCENCAGLRIGTDNVEIAALTAPRPLKLVGADDWTDQTMTVEYPTLKKIYGLMGATDRISADKFNFEHNYNETTRNAVYAFMGRWLVGIEDAASTREGKPKIEEPETLQVYSEEDPAPDTTKNAAQLETDLVATMTHSLEALAPGTNAITWEASRNLLFKSLKTRVGLVEPAAFDLRATETRHTSHKGVSVVHSTVSRVGAGENVAVVRLVPSKPTGRATLVFNTRGKAGLVNADGSFNPVAKALLDRGQTVVGFDPLFAGESFDSRAPMSKRPVVQHTECYNKTVAADQAQDLATVLSWMRTRHELRELHLVALGEGAPLALLARPALSGLGRTLIDLNGFDYGDGSATVPTSLDLPGVLQFGGLKAAAALTSPAPLWVVHAPRGFDQSWPLRSYGLGDAGTMFKLSENGPDADSIARWIDAGE